MVLAKNVNLWLNQLQINRIVREENVMDDKCCCKMVIVKIVKIMNGLKKAVKNVGQINVRPIITWLKMERVDNVILTKKLKVMERNVAQILAESFRS